MAVRKFVRQLTKKEQSEIARLIRKGGDARVVRRAQMVRLSAQGKKASEISELLGFSTPTVHRVIDVFNAEGIRGLPDKPRAGRPPKATGRYVTCLKEAVKASPIDLGYAFSSWTLPRLREHLARECNVILHTGHLARIMSQHGIVYRRPRHIMGHLRDPQDYDEKKEIIQFLKKGRLKRTRTSTSSSSMSVKFTSTQP